jgi:hypothetical protein
MVGLLYHLYNQFAFNTLQRVSPVSHGVCNVVKRIAIIFSSVFFFNQVGDVSNDLDLDKAILRAGPRSQAALPHAAATRIPCSLSI